MDWYLALNAIVVGVVGIALATDRTRYRNALRALNAQSTTFAVTDLTRIAIILIFATAALAPTVLAHESLVGLAVLLLPVVFVPWIAIRLTGGPDRARLLSVEWSELERLATDARHTEADDVRLREAEAALRRIAALRDQRTAPVIDLLVVQAERWVGINQTWTADEVVREVQLYRAAVELWPDDPPGLIPSPFPRRFLYDFMLAYLRYCSAWRNEYTEAEEASRREALAALEEFRQPGTEALLDMLARRLASELGDIHLTDEEKEALAEETMAAFHAIFPSVFVFRGP